MSPDNGTRYFFNIGLIVKVYISKPLIHSFVGTRLADCSNHLQHLHMLCHTESPHHLTLARLPRASFFRYTFDGTVNTRFRR